MGHVPLTHVRTLAVRLKSTRKRAAGGPKAFICTLALEPGTAAPGLLGPEPSGALDLPPGQQEGLESLGCHCRHLPAGGSLGAGYRRSGVLCACEALGASSRPQEVSFTSQSTRST